MLKKNFEYEGHNVVAYGRSADGINVSGLVIKFVDENGERIYPLMSSKTMNRIEEQAEELLTDEQFESELEF